MVLVQTDKIRRQFHVLSVARWELQPSLTDPHKRGSQLMVSETLTKRPKLNTFHVVAE